MSKEDDLLPQEEALPLHGLSGANTLQRSLLLLAAAVVLFLAGSLGAFFATTYSFKGGQPVFAASLGCVFFALLFVCHISPRLRTPIGIAVLVAVGGVWLGVWMAVEWIVKGGFLSDMVIFGVMLFVLGVFSAMGMTAARVSCFISPETWTRASTRSWYLGLAGSLAACVVGAVVGVQRIAQGGVFLFAIGMVGVIASAIGMAVVAVRRLIRPNTPPMKLGMLWYYLVSVGVAACVLGVLVLYNPWFLVQYGDDDLAVRYDGGFSLPSLVGKLGDPPIDFPLKLHLNPHHWLTDVSGKITVYYSDGTRKSQDFVFAVWEYDEQKTIEFKGADNRFEKMSIRMVGKEGRLGNKAEFNVDLLKTDFKNGLHLGRGWELRNP
jgi:hypothetical protein